MKLSVLLLAAASAVNALDLDLGDTENVKSVMSTLAFDMMSYYHGNESGKTPGLLPGPCQSLECYYWWEAGAMFGSLINYWTYTGDDSYNKVVAQALQYQRGERNNFNPRNQSSEMGNDDQAFWAFSAMDAAESNFPAPASDEPSWLALADAVFNFQASEWDDETCGGGLRWQVFQINRGYNLKNSISDGGFFQLAARLARYTNNGTYEFWANKMWDWMAQSPLMVEDAYFPNSLTIFDNTDTNNNCTTVDHLLWTYNSGTMLAGAAYLYNYTNGSDLWAGRINVLLEGANIFFPEEYGSNTMSEISCEKNAKCNNDQSSFKAYLSRWLAVTAHLAPFTAPKILPKLRTSAQGAAKQCVGGENGRKCGRRWYDTTWDGSMGVGQQMAALSVIGTNLMQSPMAPLSSATGGESSTNSSAENFSTGGPPGLRKAITTADKAGAAILTIMVCVSAVGASLFMTLE